MNTLKYIILLISLVGVTACTNSNSEAEKSSIVTRVSRSIDPSGGAAAPEPIEKNEDSTVIEPEVSSEGAESAEILEEKNEESVDEVKPAKNEKPGGVENGGLSGTEPAIESDPPVEEETAAEEEVAVVEGTADDGGDEETEEEVIEVQETLNIPPVSNQRRKFGYNPFPVVQCPAVKTKYNDLVARLSEVKDKLKKEGCEAERVEVESFEDLLQEGRTSFVKLVKKGMIKELKKNEINAVKLYVDKVVRKTAKISGLLKNDSCFEEDSEERKSLLGLLATAINSTAGVLGQLSGPWGMKLKFGGKFAASLLGSIDRVVRENKAYEFGDYRGYFWNVFKYKKSSYKSTVLQGYKDRILYVTSLCAYYQFKEELDEISDPDGAEQRYLQFREAAQAQIDRFEKECEDCSKIINDYRQRSNGLTYSLPGVKKALFFKEMKWKQLESYYSQWIQSADSSFEVAKGEMGPGHKTIRSLTTLVWTELELERIRKEREDDSMDQARDAVPYIQRQIESFLVDQEGPNYADNRFAATEYHYGYFKKYIRDKYLKLVILSKGGVWWPSIGSIFTEVEKYKMESKTPAELLHEIYRDDIDFASVISEEIGAKEIGTYRARIKKGIRVNLENLYRAYRSATHFCDFFNGGTFGPGESNAIGASCRSGYADIEEMRGFLKSLESTAMAVKHLNSLARFNKKKAVVFKGKPVELEYTATWIESLSKYILWSVSAPDLLKPSLDRHPLLNHRFE